MKIVHWLPSGLAVVALGSGPLVAPCDSGRVLLLGRGTVTGRVGELVVGTTVDGFVEDVGVVDLRVDVVVKLKSVDTAGIVDMLNIVDIFRDVDVEVVCANENVEAPVGIPLVVSGSTVHLQLLYHPAQFPCLPVASSVALHPLVSQSNGIGGQSSGVFGRGLQGHLE